MLIAIGTTDILFALDSIPAVFGVTEEPYIVFVANAFALLGLRALFFLVKGLLDRLVYLSTGLAVILAFIGVKLILHWAHGIWPGVPEISTNVSLIVIVVVLAITTVASLIKVAAGPDGRRARRLAARAPRPASGSQAGAPVTGCGTHAGRPDTAGPRPGDPRCPAIATPAPLPSPVMSTLDDWIMRASAALDLPAGHRCRSIFATTCWT